jgi:toxin ParE1/3/4
MASAYVVEWAPVAQRDLDEILEYIAVRDSVDAALEVYARIIARVDALALHPLRCRVVPELRACGITAYRELVLRPYGVFFRLRGEHVAIVAVLDPRRNPGAARAEVSGRARLRRAAAGRAEVASRTLGDATPEG